MKCSICYDDIKVGVKKFNCSHCFHNECIMYWNKNCPNCRALPYIVDWHLDPDFFKNIVWDNDPNFVKLFQLFPVYFEWFKNCYMNDHQLFFGEIRYLPYEVCMSCMSCQKYNHLEIKNVI